MKFDSLRDINNVKNLFVEIFDSLVKEINKLKDLNKENFIASFNKYFVDFLKEEYKRLLQKKLDYFDGRASRRQYWMFILFSLLLIVLINILGMIIPLKGLFVFILTILALITIIPNLGLAIRRLHDINLSGWWIIIAFIPYISILIMFILAIKGDKEANDYGAAVK